MLVSKTEWNNTQKSITELTNTVNRLERQQNVVIGMCKELSLEIGKLAAILNPSFVTEPNELYVDKDGMYNFQQYKQKRKARISGEGDE